MLRATETFHAGTGDGWVTVVAGDLVDDKNPIVKGREALFETAAPAETAVPSGRRPTPTKKG